jgi:hypothetical protein
MSLINSPMGRTSKPREEIRNIKLHSRFPESKYIVQGSECWWTKWPVRVSMLVHNSRQCCIPRMVFPVKKYHVFSMLLEP